MNIYSFSPFGYEGAIVSVEVDLRRGIPSVDVVGLADSAIKESRERMKVAIRNSGFEFPQERVLISLAPADVKKEGSGFDLSIALAILATHTKNKELLRESFLVMGELDLAGNVRPVRGINAAIASACEQGITRFIIPEGNKSESYTTCGKVYAVSSLKQAFECLCLDSFVENLAVSQNVDFSDGEISFEQNESHGDFSTVKNQGMLVRALQIAASGSHNLMVYGAPGCGKTLAIQRFPSILPCLLPQEIPSVSRIYSLAGLLAAGSKSIKKRPFRMPHQSASIEGMIGGGSNCLPGEVSLAHNGVLFLDEAAEFKTSVLQMLRIPLESGRVTLSRAGRHTIFPARFQLLIATNPCPCGNFGSATKVCVCSTRSIELYWRKFSAPLLDRIDLRVPILDLEVNKNFEKYNNISSKELQVDIKTAVKKQFERQNKRNAHLLPEECKKFIVLNKKCEELVLSEVSKRNLSGRAENSIYKVARTIADMADSDEIKEEHVKEALFFRKNEGGLDICF